MNVDDDDRVLFAVFDDIAVVKPVLDLLSGTLSGLCIMNYLRGHS